MVLLSPDARDPESLEPDYNAVVGSPADPVSVDAQRLVRELIELEAVTTERILAPLSIPQRRQLSNS